MILITSTKSLHRGGSTQSEQYLGETQSSALKMLLEVMKEHVIAEDLHILPIFSSPWHEDLLSCLLEPFQFFVSYFLS